MSERLEEIAATIRAAAESHPDAPEGIELYRWRWVPGDWRALRIPLESPVSAASSEPIPMSPVFRTIDIPRRAQWRTGGGLSAWVGWDMDTRQAVVFFASGGPDPARSQLIETDSTAETLTREGAWILFEERAQELLDRLDSLGLSEGEEWKRDA